MPPTSTMSSSIRPLEQGPEPSRQTIGVQAANGLDSARTQKEHAGHAGDHDLRYDRAGPRLVGADERTSLGGHPAPAGRQLPAILADARGADPQPGRLSP